MSVIVFYSDFLPGTSDVVDERVVSILHGTACRIGYIPSESDLKRRYFDRVASSYAKLGIHSLRYFDLGSEFCALDIPALMDCDAIHLSGGDPEIFVDSLQKRCFKPYLERFLAAGKLLIGVSAGAMALTKSLGLASGEFGKKGRITKKAKRGLALVPFEFFPHFRATAAEETALARYASSNSVDIYACGDNAGLEIRGSSVKPLGEIAAYNSQGITTSCHP